MSRKTKKIHRRTKHKQIKHRKTGKRTRRGGRDYKRDDRIADQNLQAFKEIVSKDINDPDVKARLEKQITDTELANEINRCNENLCNKVQHPDLIKICKDDYCHNDLMAYIEKEEKDENCRPFREARNKCFLDFAEIVRDRYHLNNNEPLRMLEKRGIDTNPCRKNEDKLEECRKNSYNKKGQTLDEEKWAEEKADEEKVDEEKVDKEKTEENAEEEKVDKEKTEENAEEEKDAIEGPVVYDNTNNYIQVENESDAIEGPVVYDDNGNYIPVSPTVENESLPESEIDQMKDDDIVNPDEIDLKMMDDNISEVVEQSQEADTTRTNQEFSTDEDTGELQEGIDSETIETDKPLDKESPIVQEPEESQDLPPTPPPSSQDFPPPPPPPQDLPPQDFPPPQDQLPISNLKGKIRRTPKGKDRSSKLGALSPIQEEDIEAETEGGKKSRKRRNRKSKKSKRNRNRNRKSKKSKKQKTQ